MAHSAAHGATTHSGEAALERQSTFHSLRYHDYRYLWLGQVGASASMWMEQIARPFLILELTDSALMLGLVTATRMVPQLLVGLWAGVLADRMDKKKILGISQAVTLATHFVTAMLIFAGLIEAWMVFVTTFVGGSAMAFNQPARQAMIAKTVPGESLHNAVALNSAAVNFMRIGGASLAGAILAVLDFGDLYLIQSIIYIFVIYTTTRIRISTEPTNKVRGSMLTELGEGFSAAKSDRTIFYILMLSLIMFIWGVPYQSVFIPLLATEELGIGRSGGALLVAVTGVGALTGALTIATIGGSIRSRGRVMMAMLIIFGIALIVLANAPVVAIAVPALLVSGAMQTSYNSVAHAYVLGRTQPELHGRIMSLFSLDRGLVPLGAALGGLFAELVGPQLGLVTMATVCIVSTIAMALLAPAVRRIQ
jgi:MFS family permease